MASSSSASSSSITTSTAGPLSDKPILTLVSKPATRNFQIDHNYNVSMLRPVQAGTSAVGSSSMQSPPFSLALGTPNSNVISLVTLKSPQNGLNKPFPGNIKQYQTNVDVAKPGETTQRQQVMLGNNNRINFAHLSRGAHEGVHVVVKKSSSNQTILIVSKPSNPMLTPSPPLALPLTSTPPPATSSLKLNSISGAPKVNKVPKSNLKINNLLMSANRSAPEQSTSSRSFCQSEAISFSSQPITLLPINLNEIMLNDTGNQQALDTLIQMSRTSLTTPATENTVESLQPSPPPQPPPPPPPVKEEPKSKASSDLTRCICGMEHDDGFMICCDQCSAWQHIVCMQINKKKIPDTFYCERCEPRVVNRERARLKQELFCKRRLMAVVKDESLDLNDSTETDNENEESSDSSNHMLNMTVENEVTLVTSEPDQQQVNLTNVDNSLKTNSKAKKTPNKSSKQLKIDNKENGIGTPSQLAKKMTVEEVESEPTRRTILTNDNNENSNDSQSGLKRLKEKKSAGQVASIKKANSNQYSAEFAAFQERLSAACETCPAGLLTTADSSSSSCLPSSSSASSVYLPRLQLNKRGSLKHLFELDCLKLVKPNVTNSAQIGQIKCTQAVGENHLLAEYCGQVMLASECLPRGGESSPFKLFYSLDLSELADFDSPVLACIDSSMSGNVTRFLRKSCVPNCRLKHALDSDGHLHFLVITSQAVEKGAELTLPLELLGGEFNSNIDIPANHCVCLCQRDNGCVLKRATQEPSISNLSENRLI